MNLRYYLRGLGIGIAVTAVVMGFSLNNRTQPAMTDEEIIAKAETLGMVMEDKVLLKQESDALQQESTTSDSEEIVMQPIQMDSSENEQADVENITEEEAVTETDDAAAKKEAEEAEAKKKAEEEAAAKKKAEEEAAAKKKAEEEAAAKKKAEEEAAAKKKAEEEAAAKKKAEEEAAAKKKAEEEAARKKAEEDAKKKETSGSANDGTIIIIDVKPGSGSETISAQLYKAGLVESATSFNAYLCSGGYDKRLTTGPHSVPAGSSYAEIAKIMTH